MTKILNITRQKGSVDKAKRLPKKWLEKTGQEFKKKNKERYHETGIRAH